MKVPFATTSFPEYYDPSIRQEVCSSGLSKHVTCTWLLPERSKGTSLSDFGGEQDSGSFDQLDGGYFVATLQAPTTT